MVLRFFLFMTSLLMCHSYPIQQDINIQFSIALKQQNVDILKEHLLDISNPKSINYGKYWSMDKINKLVSPSKENNQKVINWLNNNSIEDSEILNHGDSIICSTNIINVEKLLDITFKLFKFTQILVNFTIKTQFIFDKY